MAEKRLSVRFTTDGARDVQNAMEGLAREGGQAFRTLAERAREMGEAVRRSLLEASRQMRRAGIALTAVGTGLALAARRQINAIDELGKASSRIGIPVEALSELQFAAERSGAGLSELETALTALSRNAVNAPQNFAALGIAVVDAEGQMRPTRELLDDVADALAALPEGADRTAEALRLMGRSGTALLPMLEGGSEALNEMTEQARLFGLTVSQDLADDAARFLDRMKDIGAVFEGLQRRVLENVIPALADLSETILEFVSVIQTLPPEAIEWFGKIAGIVVVGGPLLLGLAALTKAVALVASPFVLLAGAVGLLVLGLVKLWPRLVELKDRAAEVVADIADAFWAMKESIETAVGDALDWVRRQFDGLVEWLRALPARMVQIGRDIIDGLLTGLREKAAELRAYVTDLGANLLPDWLRRGLESQSPSQVFARIGKDMMDGLRLGIEDNLSAPLGALGSLAESMAGSFERAFVGIVTGAQGARDAIAALLTDLARLLANSAFQQLAGALFGGGPTLISGPAVAAVRPMPRSFAGGGFTGSGPRSGGLDGRGGFLAMLHPNETVVDHTAGGGQATLTVRLDAGLMADLQGEMEGIAIETVQQGLDAYDRSVAPGTLRRIMSQPKRVG